MTSFEASSRAVLALAVILAGCRIAGRLARPLGQPQVVAEMLTGVLLGPSLFGLLLPAAQAWLFPATTKPALHALAQLGVVLYMFLVGLEFDLELARRRARTAIAVSWAGILAPFVFGTVLALEFTDRFPLFTRGVEPWQAALFLGSALSITAFPVLARIIREQGLSGTSLGTLALAAGSLDDAAAWCLFALVLSTFTGGDSSALLAVGGGAVYVVSMLGVGRPLLARLYRRRELDREGDSQALSFTLILLCVSAWLADSIGVHAVFGAFVLGASMPRGPLQQRLPAAMAPLTTGLLLPVFFTNTGLHTAIGLLDSWPLWRLALVVLLASMLGKLAACAVAARMCGETARESLAIGALMNARGLMELILLNVAYERGIITQTLFTILVLMAVVTTLTTVPLLNRVHPRAGRRELPAVERPQTASGSP